MPELIEIERLHIQGLCDYHCHCDYSIDAVGSIEEYCQAAVKRGLSEICFTTHYDSNPASPAELNVVRVGDKTLPSSPENLEAYVEHVHKAAEEFYTQTLSVKLGIEIGWHKGAAEEVIRLREKYDFDYVLCGLHELDDICICSRRSHKDIFSRYSAGEIVARYYEEMNMAIRSGLFDAMAHADYYMRYGRKFYGDEILSLHKPYMEDFFSALKETDTSLEVNTSASRHGVGDCYPQIQIINAARKSGVSVARLGSDAHHPEHVGYDFEAVAHFVPDLLRECEG